MRRLDLAGIRFGHFVAQTFTRLYGKSAWICRCDCGVVRAVNTANLRSGKSMSCGCQHGGTLTHGMSDTAIYATWCKMIQRCTDPRSKGYENYGGRGITVSKRWMAFENFFADMSECPKGLTLEREKNDLGYSKSNCAWATRTQQGRNKRNNRLITYKGRTMCLSAWAEHYSTAQRVLRARIVWRGVEATFAELDGA